VINICCAKYTTNICVFCVQCIYVFDMLVIIVAHYFDIWGSHNSFISTYVFWDVMMCCWVSSFWEEYSAYFLKGQAGQYDSFLIAWHTQQYNAPSQKT
jgi:hypothetical protein